MYVRLDNKTTDNYDNAKSSGTVVVCVDWEARWATPQTGSQCATAKKLEVIANNWDFLFELPGRLTAGQIRKVHIFFQAPGDLSDLLVIDQFEIRDDTGGSAQHSWGTDNTTGYCFSSDSGDFSNSHCHGTTTTLVPQFHLIGTNSNWFD
jgi:hypothetical protein